MADYIKNNHRIIIRYLVKWIFGKKHPRFIVLENEKYFWFSLDKISKDTGLTRDQIRRALWRLEYKDKKIKYIDSEPFIFSKVLWFGIKGRKLFLKLNYLKIFNYFSDDIYIIKYMEKFDMNEPLIDFNTMKVNKTADMIVNRILTENSDIFRTRIGATKTYQRCCRIVTDIYNGNFGNAPRVYSLSHIECKWFDTDGWKDRLKSVRKDWTAVEELINESIKNYRLMFDKKYMPLNKDYLPTGLDKYLYDDFNNLYPSYFIYSFKTPNYSFKQLGEVQADNIFAELSDFGRMIGNKFFQLNKDMPSGKFWTNIQKMLNWCKLLNVYDKDKTIYQFVEFPEEILNKFYDYVIEKEIDINSSTFDIPKAIENNTPWNWFICDISNKYNIDLKLLSSVTEDDFIKNSINNNYLPF